jgi:Fe-S cluster biogenesis protein NfuA
MVKEQMEQVELLIRKIEDHGNSEMGNVTRELVHTLLDLQGQGLAKILEVISGSGSVGHSIVEVLSRDSLVGSLLLLHGLHPTDFKTRVLQALDRVRPSLQSHGGGVELISVQGDKVHLRLHGACQGCPSSAMTLKYAIEEAIYEAAPETFAIHVE